MEVTTINNKVLDKKLTRKIKDLSGEFKYYEIGDVNVKNSGDCYKINTIFYALEKGKIEWDYYNQQYALKSSLTEGYIDSEFTLGYFSKLADAACKVYMNRDEDYKLAITNAIPSDNNFIEYEGSYYNPLFFTYEDIIPRQQISREYKSTLQYSFDKAGSEAKILYKNYTPKNELIGKYNYGGQRALLDEFTFGVEIETTHGVIPEELIKELGVRPVRDGSISGLEYVTIPLSGASGFSSFIETVELINKYTSSDFSCSMHVHVGNIPRTESFIVGMFKLMYHIQDDLYDLFPRYKRINTGIKRMCYTAPLSSHLMASLNYECKSDGDVSNDYKKIIHRLSGNNSSYREYVPLERIKCHPSDPGESSKWNMKERYKLLNLIPLVFTNKSTVEFRIFTVPDSVQKAIDFLIMSLSVTKFVKQNHTTINRSQHAIREYSLNRILSDNEHSYNTYMNLERRKQYVNRLMEHEGSFFEEKSVQLNGRRPQITKRVANPNRPLSTQLSDSERDLFQRLSEQAQVRSRFGTTTNGSTTGRFEVYGAGGFQAGNAVNLGNNNQ